MKSLLAGEQLREVFTINCKFGRSTLYISNLGIMIENSTGVVLDLEHISILSLQQFDKKSIKIVWVEKNHMFDFVFYCESPSEIARKFSSIKEDHHNLLKMLGFKIMEQPNEVITVQSPVTESRFVKT
jgi:hypothetical protein